MASAESALILTNRVGLHARPASLWVQTAARFRSTITATCNGRTANCKRILEVLQLGAGHGATLLVHAEGEDAQDAVDALAELVRAHFGEDE